MKKQIRIIEDDKGNQIRTLRSYKSFKSEYADFIYNKKTRVYRFPTEKFIELQEQSIRLKTKGKKRKLKTKIKKLKEVEEIPSIRTRRQVALNLVDRNASDTGNIFISIRAITINNGYGENALRLAMDRAMKDYERLSGLNFRVYSKSYVGLEKEDISDSEDKLLNDFKIHVEVFHKGKAIKTYSLE